MMTDKSKMIKSCAAAAACIAALPVYMCAPGHATRRQKLPFMGKNFAHRGLHTRDKKTPENSLAAFALAAELGYGVELDVQLSKDGYVVVFHDDDLKRVCGVDKRVDELTLSELKSLSLCGTNETIPLFTDVLVTIRGRGPIICELKTGKRNRELCEKTYDIISSYHGDICIESFNPFIVGWFRFHARDLVRGQLANLPKAYGDDFPKAGAFFLSSCLANFVGRPQFIAYKIGFRPFTVRLAQLMGAMDVCWTSHEPRNEKGRDAVIFEFYKPRLSFK